MQFLSISSINSIQKTQNENRIKPLLPSKTEGSIFSCLKNKISHCFHWNYQSAQWNVQATNHFAQLYLRDLLLSPVAIGRSLNLYIGPRSSIHQTRIMSPKRAGWWWWNSFKDLTMKSSLLSLKMENINEKSSEKLKFPSNIVSLHFAICLSDWK